jgi:hypothetical protein
MTSDFPVIHFLPTVIIPEVIQSTNSSFLSGEGSEDFVDETSE